MKKIMMQPLHRMMVTIRIAIIAIMIRNRIPIPIIPVRTTLMLDENGANSLGANGPQQERQLVVLVVLMVLVVVVLVVALVVTLVVLDGDD